MPWAYMFGPYGAKCATSKLVRRVGGMHPRMEQIKPPRSGLPRPPRSFAAVKQVRQANGEARQHVAAVEHLVRTDER